LPAFRSKDGRVYGLDTSGEARVRSVLLTGLTSVYVALLAGACAQPVAPAMEPWPAADMATPFPTDNPSTPIKIELGRRLFYDGDLSWDGTMSCATCHQQDRGFADSNKTRAGFDGTAGERNIQTLANVAWMQSLTWGGPHVDTLEHQALIPIEGFVPVEMGFGGKPEGALAQRLSDQACYPLMFRAAFPERGGKIDMDTITMALAAFQRSLVSLDAPYDRWRRGDVAAISEEAKRGAALFEEKQCSSCHAGPHFTDAALGGRKAEESFHRLAVPKDGKDSGLMRITQKTEDAGRFRTPGLRNVALSAPYMHDGEVATLSDAVRHHFAGGGDDPRLQRAADDGEVAQLVAFLESLTDDGFVTDVRFSRPPAGCPVKADAALVAAEENGRRQHNSLEGP
jgi:cytochrome c peroxidase